MSARVAAMILLASAGVAAEEPARPPAAPTYRVVAGPQYGASALHRWFMGSGYRDLWTMPIEVEVLDLEALGLVPKEKGGRTGKQTQSVRFKDREGREWRFRSVDKDPTEVLPDALHLGFAEAAVKDQISASFPVGVLVVDPLADAAGVLRVGHRLYVMPDDPRLGEFQKEFAGMLGIMEERVSVEAPVTPGFAGYDEILDTEELLKRLEAESRDRVDARAYLRARFLDVVVGDYDRHADQWDWVRGRESGRFEPVPKDRDLAFVRFTGLTPSLVRMGIPRLVKFDDSYPKVIGLAWQSRFMDRRFLSELDWNAWDEIAHDVQQRLSPAVVDEAVARMPAAYYKREGPVMAARLKRRVATLPEFARKFYEMLSDKVDVHASDEPDSVQISHRHDGSVEVALSGPQGRYFDRTLLPSETREVRIYAKGGDDRAISEGDFDPGLKVRLIGGDGNDTLDDSAGGHTHFHDSEGDNTVVKGDGTRVDRHRYVSPEKPGEDPPRDWGAGSRVVPYLHGDRAYGLLIGFSFERLHYGFRKYPFGSKHSLRLAYSTSLKTGDVKYEYQSRRSDNKSRFDLVAVGATGLDMINYYGFGNETTNTEPRAFNDVQQVQYSFTPGYRLDIPDVDLSIGPLVKYSTMRLKPATLIDAQRPYGTGDFGQAGARLGFGVGRFDHLLEKPAGLRLEAQGNYYAPVWDTTESFGEVHGVFATYARAPIPLKPTLAIRAGGRKTFGRYPVHEAAAIGGRDSIRGLPPQRYIGDASAYGGAEFRLQLFGREQGFLSRFGVFALAEGGRVWLESDPSDKWHHSVGGGVWLAVFRPKNCVSFSIAESEGDRRMYLDVGRVF